MKRILVITIIGAFLMSLVIIPSFAQKSSSDLLRQGLLGAGAGAIGGAASGAKGRDVWKGALAGAGVNIIGGALLDSISGERVERESNVQQMRPRDAYGEGYQDGFNNGYKAGYTRGYKDAFTENIR